MSNQPTKKAAAKTPARRPRRSAAEKAEPDKQTGQPGLAITDQGAFLRALGVNPDRVAAGSVRVEFDPNGVAVVTYGALLPVSPQALGFAFMASSGMVGRSDGESIPAPEEGP